MKRNMEKDALDSIKELRKYLYKQVRLTIPNIRNKFKNRSNKY